MESDYHNTLKLPTPNCTILLPTSVDEVKHLTGKIAKWVEDGNLRRNNKALIDCSNF